MKNASALAPIIQNRRWLRITKPAGHALIAGFLVTIPRQSQGIVTFWLRRGVQPGLGLGDVVEDPKNRIDPSEFEQGVDPTLVSPAAILQSESVLGEVSGLPRYTRHSFA